MFEIRKYNGLRTNRSSKTFGCMRVDMLEHCSQCHWRTKYLHRGFDSSFSGCPPDGARRADPFNGLQCTVI